MHDYLSHRVVGRRFAGIQGPPAGIGLQPQRVADLDERVPHRGVVRLPALKTAVHPRPQDQPLDHAQARVAVPVVQVVPRLRQHGPAQVQFGNVAGHLAEGLRPEVGVAHLVELHGLLLGIGWRRLFVDGDRSIGEIPPPLRVQHGAGDITPKRLCQIGHLT